MHQERYHRVLVRPAEQKPGLRTVLQAKLERLLEWLAMYPPYSLGSEESGLVFEEYRAFQLESNSERPLPPPPRA
jgi:hypothetical protein